MRHAESSGLVVGGDMYIRRECRFLCWAKLTGELNIHFPKTLSIQLRSKYKNRLLKSQGIVNVKLVMAIVATKARHQYII